MISVIMLSHSLLQHVNCIEQVLLTALDALVPLNLSHVVACYGAVDTQWYWAFNTAIHVATGNYIVNFLTMRGDPADPLTAARSLTIWATY